MSGAKRPSFVGRADHASEWIRLHQALELSADFALLLVIVDGPTTEAEVTSELELELSDRVLLHMSALDEARQSPAHRLRRFEGEAVAILRTVEASRRDVEALERCFVQLNGIRDQIAAQLRAPLIILLRPDALRRLGDVAPDLASVYAAQFNFSAPPSPRRAPAWLLLPFEAVGLLGLDPSFEPPDRSRVARLREPPPPIVELIGRTDELGLLEGRLLAGAQILCIAGPRGSGRTALARALLEHTRSRWDQVVWILARHLRKEEVFMYEVVAALAEPGEVPPLHASDLLRRYRELTARWRVFIVADDFPETEKLPAPSRGSVLVVTTSSRGGFAAEYVEPRELTASEQVELWERQHVGRPHEQLPSLTRGLAGAVVVLARWAGNAKLPTPPAPPHYWDVGSLIQSLDEQLDGDRREELRSLMTWAYFSTRVPRAVLGLSTEGIEFFERAALTRSTEGDLVLVEGCIVDDQLLWREKIALPFGYELMRSVRDRVPRGEMADELQRRCLAAYARRYYDWIEEDPDMSPEWTSLWSTADLIEDTSAALTPQERPEFLYFWRYHHRHRLAESILATYRAGWLSFAQEHLDLVAEDPAAHHLLHLRLELRSPSRAVDLAERLAAWEAAGGANRLPASIVTELRCALGLGEPSLSQPPAGSPAELTRALRQLGEGEPELLRRVLAETDTGVRADIPRRHLVWSGLTWCLIHQRRYTDARDALAKVESTARAWGTPFALLRAQLLRLELGVEAGDMLDALRYYDALLERCSELFGDTHDVTLTLLARGVELHDANAHVARATELAEVCWRELEYNATAPNEVLWTLARFFATHGPAPREELLRERIRAKTP